MLQLLQSIKETLKDVGQDLPGSVTLIVVKVEKVEMPVTFGAYNAGGIQIVRTIYQNIGQLNAESNELAEALKVLTERIETHLSGPERDELLEQVEELTQQATLPPGQRKRGIIKPLVDSLAGVCSGAGGLVTVWQMYGPTICKFFGV